MPGADLVAVVSLAALALGAGTYLVGRRKRLRLTWAQSFWYGVSCLFCRILWRAMVHGRLPEGHGQGAVIVCNHRSSVDPCFIEMATDRVVHWMVAKEYCNHWSLRSFLRLAQVIPTGRMGVDTQATKMAIRYAESGEMVGIFPEGGINGSEKLLRPGRPGAALIALKARVPVVPCYIQGAPYSGTALGALLLPAKVTVRIGKPIDLSEFYGREDDRCVLEHLTRRFLVEIASLAGRRDFQPEVAGRVGRAAGGGRRAD